MIAGLGALDDPEHAELCCSKVVGGVTVGMDGFCGGVKEVAEALSCTSGGFDCGGLAGVL